jgi:hypothetical protein
MPDDRDSSLRVVFATLICATFDGCLIAFVVLCALRDVGMLKGW